MRPEQLELLLSPSAPTLHPSGDRAVVSALRPDFASDKYVGQLWVVPTGGTAPEPRRLTRGHRDTAPRFSPDGRLLAFLRAEKGGKPQLHVMPADGGEPVRLTDSPLGAGEPRWSPDGTRIAYVARHPEPGRYGTADGVEPGAEPPRLITDQRYRMDGIGYLDDQRPQIFVVAVPDLWADPVAEPAPVSAEALRPQPIGDGDYEHESVAWSPDGSRLAFASARHDKRQDDLRVDVWTCAPDGSDVRQVTATTLTAQQVVFSADGADLWFLASDPGPQGLDFVARNTGLYRVPADGSASPARCTDAETMDLGEFDSHLTVTDDGVLVQNRTRGAVQLVRVRRDAGASEVLLDGEQWVVGHDAVSTPRGEVVVATVAAPDSAGELVLVGGGTPRRLTGFSDRLRAEADLRPLQELTVTADDGYPVHGWVVLPDGPGPHPVLLDIHGGPYAQHGWKLYDEAQILAGAGYAVLLANPRGSAGYGQEHGRCIQGAFGQRDADDVLQFLDRALAQEELRLDGTRVGVLGGSYGGYMTAWLIAHPAASDRFAAAIVERGFLDPVSFAGTSDIGWFFGEGYCGSDPEQIRAQSPMAVVDRVRTPTLVVHSEQDYRCPLEQGQRYFAELLRGGVEAQLLVFPGESHGLTRTGRPLHRRQRFEHLLRWWARYLPTDKNRPSTVATN